MEFLSSGYEVKLSKLRYSPHALGGWVVHIDDGKASRTGSIDTLGDGVRMSLNVLLSMMTSKARLILIDEIESHQHVKGLAYSKSIVNYVKRNNSQLFVTTHSLEAVKILLELAKENSITSVVHHFILREGDLETRTIPGLDAEVVIDLTGDVRFADEYV